MVSDIIKFAETPQEELTVLNTEVQDDGDVNNRAAAAVLVELFGDGLPSVEADPVEALRLASRDFKLGRLLKERGVFRLFMVTKLTDASGMPFYRTQINPDTQTFFSSQEEFIGWFCSEAGVTRVTIFTRIATIERLLWLGMSLEEAYNTLLRKPHAIREALKIVADWDGEEIVGMTPEIAATLAERVLPADTVATVRTLAAVSNDESEDDDDRAAAQDKLNSILKPALAGLVQEVAAHESTRDALDFIRHDIAGKPEIKYRWDYQRDEMVCEVISKRKDHAGTEYIDQVLTVRLIADPVLPDALRADLIKRLPIVNRNILE